MDKVGIWNIALALVAERRALSPDDTATGAQLCADHYDAARDAVLAARPWSFAISRLSIAAAGAAPTWGPTKAFDLPASVLRVLSVTDGEYELDEWRVEGRQIVATYDGPVKVRCVERIEDESRFSPGFVETLAAYLAHLVALPLTENRGLVLDLWKVYRDRLVDAAAVDGQQGRPRAVTASWASEKRGA